MQAEEGQLINFSDLIPDFSKEDLRNVQSFFEINQKYKKELDTALIESLIDHEVWGPLIKSMPEEVREQNDELTVALQRKAIYEGNWLPLIEHQFNQGAMYAQMGFSFRGWYEILNIFRDFLVPIIAKDYQHDPLKLTNCFNGLNLYLDFAMSVLGESYLLEKKKIIEQQIRDQKKLNKELESFAYIISHDLKTPLRGISSLSSWIVEDCKDELNETGQEYLTLMVDRVQRMEALIDGVLRYSRIGRVDMELSTVNLNNVVQEIVDRYDEDNIQIRVKEDLPILEISKTMMSQLFGNLIENAVSHCNSEVIRVEVGVEKIKGIDTYYIKDNGPGIDPEFKTKVFEIFQTLQPKDTSKSTGIGLTIVRKIIDTYQGEIELNNLAQGGLMVQFTLPKAKVL